MKSLEAPMSLNKKKEDKRHLRLVKNYDLEHSVEGSFQIGESDFDESDLGNNRKLTKIGRNWTHPGVSGRTYDENEEKRKDEKEQVDFTGFGPKGYERSDERLYEEVCEALMQNSEVDATNIGVHVSEGVVYLSGRVKTRKMKKVAELVVYSQSGVKDVRNNLVIIKGAEDTKGLLAAKGKDLGIF
jgi:osmotically-inducible protein OsmY